MNDAVCVAHPISIDGLTNTGRLKVTNQKRCGPLGLVRYWIEFDEDLTQKVQKICATPYAFKISTYVLEQYALSDYLDMLKFFLFKTIKAIPTGFEIIRYTQPRTTYIYPMYVDIDSIHEEDCEYLYVTKREKKLLATNTLSMLGFYPISNDPSVIPLHFMTDWDGSTLIKSELKSHCTIDLADRAVEDAQAEHRRVSKSNI